MLPEQNAEDVPVDGHGPPKIDVPRFVYRYRSLAGEQLNFTLQTITRHELYFASPLMFNDPFEGHFGFTKEAFQEAIPEFANELRRRPEFSSASAEALEGVAPEAIDFFRRKVRSTFLGQAGVVSLSEECDSILLWSHYADCHKGICLEFDLQEAAGFSAIAQVVYQDECPLTDLTPESSSAVIVKACYTKAAIWSYEREYRFMRLKGAGSAPYPPKMLSGVILGAEMDPNMGQRVLEAIAEHDPNTRVGMAGKDPWEYKIRVVYLGRIGRRRDWKRSSAMPWAARFADV